MTTDHTTAHSKSRWMPRGNGFRSLSTSPFTCPETEPYVRIQLKGEVRHQRLRKLKWHILKELKDKSIDSLIYFIDTALDPSPYKASSRRNQMRSPVLDFLLEVVSMAIALLGGLGTFFWVGFGDVSWPWLFLFVPCLLLGGLWFTVLRSRQKSRKHKWRAAWSVGVVIILISAPGLLFVSTEDNARAVATSGNPEESETEQAMYVGQINRDCFGMNTKEAMEGAIAFATMGEPGEYEEWLALHAGEIVELEVGDSVEVLGSYGQVSKVRAEESTQIFYTYYEWVER